MLTSCKEHVTNEIKQKLLIMRDRAITKKLKAKATYDQSCHKKT